MEQSTAGWICIQKAPRLLQKQLGYNKTKNIYRVVYNFNAPPPPAVLQTVQRPVVYSAVFDTVYYKEHLKSFDKNTKYYYKTI